MRAVVVGAGAVGSRVAALLRQSPTCEAVTVVNDRAHDRLPASDVTVVCAPQSLRRLTVAALGNGSHVVSPVDDPAEIAEARALDARARYQGTSVALGTAMAPGLSCLLASHLRRSFDTVTEVHIASVGTGGPACARRHHAALSGMSVDWVDGRWERRPGGSGRELVWFPEPVGGADCYRAALADPALLAPAFPECRRITARLEATRRDRFTSWLPMLRPPHPEGLVGAVRAEVRGWCEGRAETKILGCSRPPAVVAAAVTAVAAEWAAAGRFTRPGAGGLAELVGDPGAFLADLAPMGVTVAAFAGTDL